jgi:hypothetical protein
MLISTFGRSEADEEIQDLLQGSQGLGGASLFIRSYNFDPVVTLVDQNWLPKLFG